MENSTKNKNGILSLLPIEMWEAILDRVDDSKDLQNFCKAWKFPDFYTILHRTKQSWLIDQVFPLIFPFIATKSQILVCRLVCRRWRNGVDSFLENNSSRRPANDNDYLQHKRLGIQTKILRDRGLLTTSFTLEKIQKILQVSEDVFPITIRNPIVGRSVNFNLPDNQHNQAALEFLRKVGHHIRDFRLEIHENTPLKFFECLKRHLKFLPNLKRLNISGETELVVENTVIKNTQEFYENKESLNLPRLQFLETLELTIFGQYKKCIMETFLISYPCKRLGLNMHSCKIPASVKLDQLTELTVSIDCETQLEVLEQQQFNQLKRLTVFIIRNSRNSSYPDFSKTFQLINGSSFAQNLKCLSIEFPVTYTIIQWNSQGPLPILELPKLKTLELREGMFHSFNFICQLANLENLHLYKYRWGHRLGMAHHYEGNSLINHFLCNSQRTSEEVEILELKDILENPTNLSVETIYRSNLWKVLPRLKHFTVSKAGNTTVNVEHGFRRNFVVK